MEKDLLIQKYLNNRLTKDEQVLFNDFYKKDADFKEEVQLHKDLKAVIRKEEKISLKKKFQKIDTKTSFNWSRLLIAAGFALLLSVGSFFMFKDNTLSHQELFAANFEPYRNVMHPVVRGEENLTQIEKAFVFYENGDFSNFIEKIKSSDYKNKDYNFYIANAYLANGNTKEAKLILEDYIKNNNTKFYTKAHWYLGLIYLNLDETESAKKAFKIVEEKDDFKLQKTLKILQQLD